MAKIINDDHTTTETAHAEEDEILWVTEFEEEKAREFNEKVLKQSVKNPKKPLIIYIDSYGGAVDALSAMVTTLETVPNKIITVCMGKAMSCGSILLSMGDERYVAPHGRVMIHEVSGFSWGNINDMKNRVAEINRLNEYWMGVLAENCGMSLEQLLKKFTNKKRDIFFNAERAVAFGLADKVGVPRLKKVIKFEVEVSQ